MKRSEVVRLTGLACLLMTALVIFAMVIQRPRGPVTSVPTLMQLPAADEVVDLPESIPHVSSAPTELPVPLAGSSSLEAPGPGADPVALVIPNETPSPTPLPNYTPLVLPEAITQPVLMPGPTQPPVLVVSEVVSQPVPSQVVIVFAPDASEAERAAYITQIGGVVTSQIDPLDTVVVSVPPEVEAASLPESPVVAQAEPDYTVAALGSFAVPPSDPLFPDQWALVAIGAPEAWAALPDDLPPVTVAVIDSGICANHPDLQGRILPGYDFVQDDADPQDTFGHGCSVAGIIFANIDDGIGMAGVAPNANVMALRVLNETGIGTYSDVAAALVWAADHGAQVANLSLGGSMPSTVLENAVNYAVNAGVTIVAAAGNGGNASAVLYPAAYEPVISVGAVDSSLNLAGFNSGGTTVDMLAPGVGVLTTNLDGGHVLVSGTSFAAPHVSGAAIFYSDHLFIQEHGSILSLLENHETNDLSPTFSIAPTLELTQVTTDDLSYQGIIGDDRRIRVLNTVTFPWTAIVSIESDGAPSCSGTLIAPDYVLTAAHCILYDGRYSNNLTVIAGRNGVYSPYGSRNVVRWSLPSEWFEAEKDYDPTRSAVGYDYAVLDLDSPYPQEAGIFEIGAFSDNYLTNTTRDFMIAGYPGDKAGEEPGDQLWFDGGSLNCVTPTVLGYQIDTEHGESGSGIWTIDGTYRLVGVHNNGWGEYSPCPPDSYNSGSRITDQVLQFLRDSGVPFTLAEENETPPPNDTIPPTGSWLSPANGSSVGSAVTLSGTATDDSSGVAHVQFTADWNGWPDHDVWYVVTTESSPVSGNTYSHTWDLCATVPLPSGGTTTIPNGTVITLGMDITDSSGNTAYSPDGERTITKSYVCDPSSDDTTPPTASWISPTNGTVIDSKSFFLSANASDNVGGSGVREVRFSALWGGEWHGVGVDTTAPYSVEWDWCASGVPNGDVELGLEVWDNAENQWVYSEHLANIHVVKNNNCLPPWFLEWSTAEHPPLEVDIHARVQWTSDFSAFRVCFDGQNCQETSATELFYRWNTYGWADGDHLITVEYRRMSDGGNWATALVYEQPFYLSPNRAGYAPCDGGEGATLTSGSDCIRVTESQRDMAPVGWADRSDLWVSVTGSVEAWVFDGVDYQGTPRVVRNGETRAVGGNVSSIRLDPPAPPPPPLPTAPFACDSSTFALYHFDEGVGSTAYDACGYGASSGVVDAGVTWTTGQFGSALDFTNPPDGRGVTFGAFDVCPITVEMWVRRLGEGRVAGQLGANGNTGQNRWLIKMLGNTPWLEIWSAGGSRDIGSYREIADDAWHLLMVTFDCVNTGKMYLDNELVATLTTDSSWSPGSTTFEVGAAEGIGRFEGQIDEVRVSYGVRVPQQPLPESEKQALIALYNSTNGPSWWNQTGWLSDSDPCTWYGVTCANGHVTMLQLVNNGLGGTLPVELGTLTGLQHLYFSMNQMTGSLPDSLGGLMNLERLDLYHNLLTGSIPSTLGSLQHLTYLQLGNNQLTGSIPISLATLPNLQELHLGFNQLTGSIPAELGNLSNLRDLNLVFNQLSGTIPPSLGNLGNLSALYLAHNQLTGSIPLELVNLSLLSDLYLESNQLTGEIPAQLGNLSSLILLRLGDNPLGGQIPPDLGNLTELRGLYLRSNELTGSIPPELGNLANLEYLYLGNNQLSGAIPTQLGSLSQLGSLGIENNQLSGSIPQELANLSELQWLDLGFNHLTGGIPPELGNLSTLLHLYLRGNPLGGSIPPQLGNLANLYTLNLWNTGLTGSIPPELGNLSNLGNLFLDSNQLTGSIPGSLGNLTYLQTLNLYGNQLSGSLPASLGNLSQLSYLGLANNQLSGSIPPELGSLPLLYSLHLYGNELTGSIPPELGNLTNLRNLYLDSNQLTGSIPPQLGNLSNLYVAQLGDNQLSGGIPPELGNLTGLWGLYLYNNHLTGSIPASLGNLSSTQLQWLRLDGNQLTGEIPSSLGNLNALLALYLYNNQLSGSIPASLGNLSNLNWIRLENNQLSGNIPDLSGLTALEEVSLATNQLTGPMPGFSNSPNLARLDLFNNQLTGTIADLSGLHTLSYLNLGWNQLSGEIPAWLNNLSGLTYLYLNGNPLSGPVPSLNNLNNLNVLGLGDNLTGSVPDFSGLPNLYWLDLSSNQFTGEIPGWVSNLGGLVGLDLRDNQITGAIPPELSNLTTLQHLFLSGNRLTGRIPSELGGLVGGTVGNLAVGLQSTTTDQVIEGMPPQVLAPSLSPASVGIPPETHARLGEVGMSGGGNQEVTDEAFSPMLRVVREEPVRAQALTGLLNLWLDNNQLTGQIPPELGTLITLGTLNVSRNALGGDIPDTITSLANLDWLDVGFNALTATNPDTISFLNTKDPYWAQTQTIAPDSVSVVSVGSDNVALSWLPILYAQDSGHYEVRYATVPGGPFDHLGCTTNDKTETSCVVGELTSDTTYYFVVRTFTAANSVNPQNDLWSGYSAEVAATTAAGTGTPESTPEATETPTASDTPEPTVIVTTEPTATDTSEPTVTDTPIPTSTDTLEPTVTDTPIPTITDTPVPTVTDTPVPTVTDTTEPTATDTSVSTATNTPPPTPTPWPVDLIENGDFSRNLWRWQVTRDLSANVTSGVLNAFRTAANSGGAISQDRSYRLGALQTIAVELMLGNASAVPKTVRVVVRPGNSTSGQIECTYVVAPFAPMALYRILGQTGSTWSGNRTTFALTLVEADNQPSLLLDNVAVRHVPGISVSGVNCFDNTPPTATVAPSITPTPTLFPSATSTSVLVSPTPTATNTLPPVATATPTPRSVPVNLLENGDFTRDLWRWQLSRDVTGTVVSGTLNVYRTSTNRDGTISQDMSYPVGPGQAVELGLWVANTSGVPKTVRVALSPAGSTSGQVECMYVIEPNTPLTEYRILGQTGLGWSGNRTTFVVTLVEADNQPNLLLDSAVVRHHIGLNVAALDCVWNGVLPTDASGFISGTLLGTAIQLPGIPEGLGTLPPPITSTPAATADAPYPTAIVEPTIRATEFPTATPSLSPVPEQTEEPAPDVPTVPAGGPTPEALPSPGSPTEDFTVTPAA